MAKFDFSTLHDQYPAIISHMPPIFDSHRFILELARQNQMEYVKALYAYTDSAHDETPTPFQFVHTRLAIMLKDFPELVEQVGTSKPSPDIFGNSIGCTEWRKV